MHLCQFVCENDATIAKDFTHFPEGSTDTKGRFVKDQCAWLLLQRFEKPYATSLLLGEKTDKEKPIGRKPRNR